ncbi:aminotransferase class I/II-fold pyridoxal phosphate-dependent enzyme [Streptomyces mobaraensis NBRC 13819 = DSM 40847]|uniref:cysteine-S-conjugate beta-lyase n=2 Tax=Streptomyces mobaraensis TaxID=35621 RepID=A0A5N5W4K8_STRMB|nr:aminotransferase class I/II-fold pyridoxal phosphate-dependent enzyme [Streptomyces mobaraensis]EMF00182.1 transferase [Streptomyces mobaraensis NBRC 13819 = DSM 40847]KAB7839908.1 aminotransferase class I/II-fold pyridoxal phosphate-dependent enzyme [Streptomyces mobaraensis]QTT72472.1 aminotransferase class I/II-fold pyridoxal phosphate-dependent enzyme [Streptomyces mobaraensis NBRC 13819 = DSM 40847]
MSSSHEHPDPLRALSLDRLRRRTSAKWRTYPPDVLPLWVAEMDVPLPEPVARVLTEAVALGDTGYATGAGYAEALAWFARERWQWDGVAVDRTAVVADVMRGVVEVLRLVTGPGDAVVLTPPVYPPFHAFVAHEGRRVVAAPLDGAGRLDAGALEAAFREAVAGGRRAALLLSSPHNPTGTVHTRPELTAVAELARRYGVRVVADEVHAPLVLPGAGFVPYLSVQGAEDAFSVVSASKAWNLAGLKAALVVAGPEAAGELRRTPSEASHGPSHLGVLAHTAALRHAGDWLDALLGGLDANRRLLGDLLARHLPEVGYRRPEGGYLVWLDCRAAGLGDDPAAAFLERGRVALTSGPPFGAGGAGHVRLNLATSPDVLREAVRRMARTVGRERGAPSGAQSG